MNRKLITGALAASALVALSACGVSTDTKPAAKATPSASAAAAPQAMSSSMAAKGGVVDGQIFATMVANAMVASKSAHVTLNSNGKPIAAGDSEFTNPVNGDMKMSQQGMSLEILQFRGVLYIKGIPGSPKPWVKVDPKGKDAFSKAMASMGDTSKNNDPRAAVAMLKGVKGRDLGAAQVDGVPTRQFAFTVGLAAYGKVLNPQMQKVMSGMVKGPITMNYWVGEDNLPRKVTTAMTVSGKKQTTKVIYSDWGKPVHLAAPPAAQVATPPRA